MTLKYWLITSALAVAAFPAGAELYRWVDASGMVHYSDTPQEGAEKIELRPTNVIRSPRSSTQRTRSGGNSSASDEDREVGAPEPYVRARIQSPRANETLWNLGGTLSVQVDVNPALQEGHGVVLIYDGRPVNEQPAPSSTVTIDNVYRGEHTVRASIRDEQNNSVFEGPAITFFVQQSTVN